MANVISLKFGDQINTVTGRLDYTGNELDDNDIGYWIGTAGNTVAYSDIRLSGEVVVGSTLLNAFNRNTATDSGSSISTTPQAWTFNNYVLLPTSISLFWRTDSAATIDIEISYENENGVYESLGVFTETPGTSGAYFNYPVFPQFWSKSFRIARVGSGSNFRVDEIFMYGAFRREDNSTLGLFPANSTIETVKDSQLNINSIDGPLNYQAALSSKPNNITSNIRTILTGDLELDNKGRHTIISLDPNGATRNVILPQFPRLDHYIRIINVDGSSVINVRETVGGPVIQELSNASTVLTLEAIWVQEDSIWHITA